MLSYYCIHDCYIIIYYTDNWEKIKSDHYTTQGVIGIVFNTDGVTPFKSSRLTIWPIYIALPPQLRMLKRNIITCLIWVAKSKPPMPLFLRYFEQMLQKVNSTGLTVKTPDGTNSLWCV